MMINTVYNEDGEFVREEPFDADVELDKLYPTEQTEQEYLQTCDTEQLAEFLFRIAYMCSYCGDEAHSSQEKMQQCHFGKCGCRRKDWEVWLKQPHQVQKTQESCS